MTVYKERSEHLFFFSVIHKKVLCYHRYRYADNSVVLLGEIPSVLDHAGNRRARGRGARSHGQPILPGSVSRGSQWGARGLDLWAGARLANEELVELGTQTCWSTAPPTPPQRSQACQLHSAPWQGMVPTHGSKEVCSSPRENL